MDHRPIPKWIWNAAYADITPEKMREQLQGFKEADRYGGLMICLWGFPGYMSEAHLERYGQALVIMRELGLHAILWDEDRYPSGKSGARLDEKYQSSAIKMAALPILAAKLYKTPAKSGLLGAVLYNPFTKTRIDVSGKFVNGRYTGKQKPTELLLVFTIAKSRKKMLDYLSREAVANLIENNHQIYYDHFKEYFGGTIQAAFYDEPCMQHIRNGRAFSGSMPDGIKTAFGVNPVLLYPALFMNIGPDTCAARNMLYSVRSAMYRENYVGQLARWCAEHGIELTGHMDQEEIRSPAGTNGDLLRVFEHQHIPGVDEIWNYERGAKAYKIVSSSACLYDKPQVMCEVWGGMSEAMEPAILRKEILDLFGKGVNFLVPHGAWYDSNPKVVNAPPELSYRSAKYAAHVSKANDLAARLSEILTGGRHVAEVCLYYPIETLYAGFRFDLHLALNGRVRGFKARYADVGERLYRQLHIDYTYMHPDVLASKCEASDGQLRLNNRTNWEAYRVMVLADAEVISPASLEKIDAFAQCGGRVVIVGRFARYSSEAGKDAEVRELAAKICASQNVARFADPNEAFDQHLRDVLADRDVIIPPETGPIILKPFSNRRMDPWKVPKKVVANRGLVSYIHKVKDGRDVFYFANTKDGPRTLDISVKGLHNFACYDPVADQQVDLQTEQASGRTRFTLRLKKDSAVVLREESIQPSKKSQKQ